MVFALPVFLDLLTALCIAGLACLAGWLIAKLAAIIPNPGILGVHPLGFIHDGFDDLGNAFINYAEGQWQFIKSVVTDIANEVDIAGDSVLSVLAHHADLLDYVGDVFVPGKIAIAVSGLNNALQQESNKESDDHKAAIAAAAAASAAVVTLHDLVGNPKARTVEDDISNAHADAVSSSESYTDGKVTNLTNSVASQLGLVWSAIAPLQTAINSTIPREIADTASKAAADTASALATATGQLQSAVNGIYAAINANEAADSTALSQAVAGLNSALSSASAAEQSALASTAAAIRSEASKAITAVATNDQAALSSATTNLQGQITQLQTTTTIALPALPDVSIPGELTIPLAVGGLAQVLAGVIAEVDSCMISSCGSGPNNLRNALLSELGLFSAVGELGFLTQAARDPIGTADGLAGVLEGAYNAGHDAIDALLSL